MLDRSSRYDRRGQFAAIAVALAVCVLAAVLEAALSGTNVEAYLASLAMPPFSPPLWAWLAIGAVYYLICFIVLYRVIRHGQTSGWRTSSLALVMVLMVANAAWNWTFFGIQDPFVSLLVLGPYNAVVVALLFTVSRVDRVAMSALLPYAVYLIYADYWSHGVWRLNP
ncbi:MAG TPA: TspO/MBR family protein [Thermoanaerobaculia bacterium]|nr:TspO/MBR family protein [Thermoanaerobaculia bacterium]